MRARPRPRRDRGDHVVHEHVQPVGDDRRGAARQEGGRARARAQAVGQDHARAGVQGRHGLLRAGRPDAVPRQARLQPRRLRLHDLHRQLRAAAGADQPGRQRPRPRGRVGALGQPQLRGPDQPRREDELPGVAAAGRRLRAGRVDGRRHHHRAARARTRTGPTSSSRTSGRPARRSRRSSTRPCARRCSAGDYADVFAGDDTWQNLPTPTGNTFEWDPDSTYVRKPPYFDGMPADPEPVTDIEGARVLAVLGDSVTTDHISPAGSIKADSPAGKYLPEHGVDRKDFNSYGSRRGNHEVMIRGTFANIRLRNLIGPRPDDIRGRVHPGLHRRAARTRRSTTPPSATPRPARRSWSSPARSTARGPRATGRPRAPRCSASGRSSRSPTSGSTAPT